MTKKASGLCMLQKHKKQKKSGLCLDVEGCPFKKGITSALINGTEFAYYCKIFGTIPLELVHIPDFTIPHGRRVLRLNSRLL